MGGTWEAHGRQVIQIIIRTQHTQHVQGNKRSKRHYRCRRYRKSARENPGRKREQKSKGCIGVQCRARYELIPEPDGSLLAIFRGYHNHDCQKGYLSHVKPVHVCQWLREQVDRKLHAGVTKSTSIMTSIQQDGRDNEISDGVFRTHEEARAFYMAQALTADMISNRRVQLGLVNPYITNKDDAASVRNLVETWKRDKGDDSPVVYYKVRGQANSDTSEEEKSLFKEEDFLLVLQTPAQAKMMRDNPVSPHLPHICLPPASHLPHICLPPTSYLPPTCLPNDIRPADTTHTHREYCSWTGHMG